MPYHSTYLKSKKFGEVEVRIDVGVVSAVDSYIVSAHTEDGRTLDDAELEELDKEFPDAAWNYVFENGLHTTYD